MLTASIPRDEFVFLAMETVSLKSSLLFRTLENLQERKERLID